MTLKNLTKIFFITVSFIFLLSCKTESERSWQIPEISLAKTEKLENGNNLDTYTDNKNEIRIIINRTYKIIECVKTPWILIQAYYKEKEVLKAYFVTFERIEFTGVNGTYVNFGKKRGLVYATLGSDNNRILFALKAKKNFRFEPITRIQIKEMFNK